MRNIWGEGATRNTAASDRPRTKTTIVTARTRRTSTSWREQTTLRRRTSSWWGTYASRWPRTWALTGTTRSAARGARAAFTPSMTPSRTPSNGAGTGARRCPTRLPPPTTPMTAPSKSTSAEVLDCPLLPSPPLHLSSSLSPLPVHTPFACREMQNNYAGRYGPYTITHNVKVKLCPTHHGRRGPSCGGAGAEEERSWRVTAAVGSCPAPPACRGSCC